MLLKPWPNGHASRGKFAKPKRAYGLAKGGQMDSQVGSQVSKSHKFHAYHWLMHFYNNRLLAINLCRLVLGGQTVKNLHLLASKFELDQSQHKSSQVHASQHKWMANLRVRLAKAKKKFQKIVVLLKRSIENIDHFIDIPECIRFLFIYKLFSTS